VGAFEISLSPISIDLPLYMLDEEIGEAFKEDDGLANPHSGNNNMRPANPRIAICRRPQGKSSFLGRFQAEYGSGALY